MMSSWEYVDCRSKKAGFALAIFHTVSTKTELVYGAYASTRTLNLHRMKALFSIPLEDGAGDINLVTTTFPLQLGGNNGS